MPAHFPPSFRSGRARGYPLAILPGFLAGLRRDRTFDVVASDTALVSMTLPEFNVFQRHFDVRRALERDDA